MSDFFDRWFKARIWPSLMLTKTALGFVVIVLVLTRVRPDVLVRELSISFPMTVMQFMVHSVFVSYIAVTMYFTGDYLIYLTYKVLKFIYSRLRPGDETI